MTRYTYTTSLSWGGDTPTAELDDIVVSYTYLRGAPERGPSYASGGEPADPDEIDDIRVVSIDGKPAAEWDRETLQAICDRLEMDHYEAMVEEARAEDADAREAAMERRREDR